METETKTNKVAKLKKQESTSMMRESSCKSFGDGEVGEVWDIITRDMAKRWGITYCGGAKPVEKTVREFGTKHGIEFRIESFGW